MDKFVAIQVEYHYENTVRHGMDEVLAHAICEWVFNGKIGNLYFMVLTEGGSKRRATITLPKLPKRRDGNRRVVSGRVTLEVKELT